MVDDVSLNPKVSEQEPEKNMKKNRLGVCTFVVQGSRYGAFVLGFSV